MTAELLEAPPHAAPHVDAGVIEDARERQRRHRRTGWALAVVAAALGVGLIIGLTGGGGNSHSAGRPSRGRPSGAAAKASSSRSAFAGEMQAEYGMSVDGPHGLIVVNNAGIFRTTNDGRTWRDITPGSLRRVVDHVSNVIAIGDHIWLELEGTDLFGFLPFSTDGGRSWHTARIRGSIQLSNLVFTNARDGWVTVTDSGFKTVRYRSTDGGVTWRRSRGIRTVKSPADVSGTTIRHVRRPAKDLEIRAAVQFPNGLTWAQAIGPSTGIYYPTYLLRSDNGGRTWRGVNGP